MEKKIDPLVEWAVWGHLDSKTDLELILLKGHLLLEKVLDILLERNNIKNYENFSFYRKISVLNKINFDNNKNKKIVISSLTELNKLRNKLAHELLFDIRNGELGSWSSNILESLDGTKYTRFTFRTKIVHSFSVLSINILNLTN